MLNNAFVLRERSGEGKKKTKNKANKFKHTKYKIPGAKTK